MWRSISQLCVLAWCGLVHVAGYADDRLAAILARGSVRVATTGDYPPFSYKNPLTGEYEGADVQLASALAQSLGVRLELVPTSWPSLVQDLDADKFDIAMSGISVTLERQKHGLFSIPYLRDGKTPITRCENQARFQNLKQIDQAGVRVIVNPGGTNEAFARAHIRHGDVVVYPDNTTIFDALLNGRADLMLTDGIEARLQETLRPALCAVHPDMPFDHSEKAYLLPNDLRWLAWVNQWVHQTEENGVLAQVQNRWLNWKWIKYPPKDDLETLAALVAERLKLADDVARYKWNNHVPIVDAVREQAILTGLVEQASKVGIPSDVAIPFFRAQIEASKAVQNDLFAKWKKAGQGDFDNVPDLNTETRHQLDILTGKLLESLAHNLKTLQNPVEQDHIANVAAKYLSKDDWGVDAARITRNAMLFVQ